MNWKQFETPELENWQFQECETCRGFWEILAKDNDGNRVCRNGASSPELLLEEVVAEALEIERLR